MRTRMTELFGIRYPIMLAGMNWLTTPKLVAAVSNAGGLGILGSAQFSGEKYRDVIRQIKSMTDKPFGVNITLGMGSRTLVEIAIEERVPVVNYALGRPPDITPLIQAVHGYGGKVVGTVSMLRHGLRSEQLGADMLSVTGYEAAGHSGNVGALVLIPTITSAVKIPCVGAGGYCDGRSLAAALALGAEGISMGTRFAATKEAEVPESIKQAWLKATEEDTVIDPVFDGINCRVMRNTAADEMLKKRHTLPIVDAFSSGLYMKRELKLSWRDLFRTANSLRKQPSGIGGAQRGLGSAMRFAVGGRLFVRATVEGDAESGLLMMGQTAGRIGDIPSVTEIIERTVAEAKAILEKMTGQIRS